MLHAKYYLFWVVKLIKRWIVFPARQLQNNGINFWIVLMVFVGFVTMTSIKTKQENFDEWDYARNQGHNVPHTGKHNVLQNRNKVTTQYARSTTDYQIPKPEPISFSPTGREPDSLTYKLIDTIYPNMNGEQAGRFSIAVHQDPAILLSRKYKTQELGFNSRQSRYDDFEEYKMREIKKNVLKKSKRQKTKPMLCVNLPHKTIGLGNLMFLYASIYSIAKDSDHFIASDDTFKRLQTTFKNINYTQINTQITEIGTIIPPKFATFERFSLPQSDVCISGYLQSWRYFHKRGDEIKSLYEFSSHILSSSNRLLNLISYQIASKQGVLPRDIVLIGMHVRRADLLLPMSRKQGYRVPAPSYFYKAMLYFYAQYQHAHFVLITDDLHWSKHIFKDFERVVTFNPTSDDPALDLSTLSKCHHVIGSVGTFSWWGAYLSGSDAVFYDSPYKTNSILGYGFNAYDYFLPKWKLIGDS